MLTWLVRNLPFIIAWCSFYFWLGPLKALVTGLVWTSVEAYEYGFDKSVRQNK